MMTINTIHDEKNESILKDRIYHVMVGTWIRTPPKMFTSSSPEAVTLKVGCNNPSSPLPSITSLCLLPSPPVKALLYRSSELLFIYQIGRCPFVNHRIKPIWYLKFTQLVFFCLFGWFLTKMMMMFSGCWYWQGAQRWRFYKSCI